MIQSSSESVTGNFSEGETRNGSPGLHDLLD